MSARGPASPDWRYRALTSALAPVAAGHGAWQALRHGDARIARQRLGLGVRARDDRPVWIHMASVGEVNAAQPLVSALVARGLPLVATTFTPTGAAMAARRFGPAVEHVYLPLDLGGAPRRFLARIRPRCALVMETEIWPRLFHRCREAGIPLLIVNGRLSARTLDRAPWIRAIYRRALGNVELVLARSDGDARAFIGLGMDPGRVRVVDNIKFAAQGGPAPEPIRLPRPHVVLASSHDDEELQVCRAWLGSPLRDTHTLVLVPRHPARGAAIAAQVRGLGEAAPMRSRAEAVTAHTRVYLADTFGELPALLAGADLAFIGGSLIARGGQNPIEAARLGKAVLFGPHMENFPEERALLLAHDAAVEVRDGVEMVAAAAALIAEPARLRATGERGRAAIGARGDIVARYLAALAPWLSAWPASSADHAPASK